jgi:VCBS repeat-containing protein
VRLDALEDRCLLAAPVAVNDFYVTPIDTPTFEPAPGILINDTDPDGDAFQSIQVDFTGTLGFVAITTLGLGLGEFSYSPPLGFTGIDTFSYRVTDTNGEQSDLATVTFYVGVPPTGQPDVYATPENTTLEVFPFEGVLINDTGFPIQAVLVNGPAHGSLSLFGNGSFTYVPALDYTGADQFVYKPWDGVTPLELIDPVTVFLFVNDVDEVPVANTDNYSVSEDTTLTPPPPGVLLNDYSPDGLPLTALLVSGPSNILPGGFTLNPDGSFTYTPLPNYFGTDSFVYRAIDSRGMASEETTVFLTITPVNDAPTAVDDEFSVNEDQTLYVAGPGILTNDTDPEGDLLSSFVVAAPLHGSLSLSSDGSFVYTPNPNFSGIDTFTYRVSDGSLPSLNVATVTITVLPVNDVPIARDDVFATSEDMPLFVAAPGVLANDSDADGDPLTAILVNNPLHGSVTLNADGSFTYTPDPLFNGVDTFTYRASDGLATSEIATVTILVGATNHAPTANDDDFETSEGQALIVSAPGVLGNDTDPDGDLLSSFLITNPQNGTLVLNSDGSFTYIPNSFFSGIDSFTYQTSDGELLSNVATVTITVLPVNDPPVATDDGFSTLEDQPLIVAAPGVLANDFDPDGGPLTAVLVTNPLHGVLVLDASGAFVYTPNPDFYGTDSFTYRASDGTLVSDIATVTITVVRVNDPPVAVDNQFTTNEDQAIIIAAPGILANDSDTDGDPLTAILVSNPSHGILVLNGDGSFTYTPYENFFGTDSFVYQAFDGSDLSNLATVTITVVAVNDPPVATNDEYATLEDQALIIAAPGVLANDFDVDGNPLTAVLVTNPLHGVLVLDASGAFVYTPNPNFYGEDSFTYRAWDGTAFSNIATVTINVINVNDPPVAVDDQFTTIEDQPIIVAPPGILANDTDADGDPLTAIIVSNPSHGVLVLNGDGSLTYTPFANFAGIDTFTYRAFDGIALSNLATVTINVTPVADTPTARDDNYSVREDRTLTVTAPGILFNDSNPDGGPVVITIINGPLYADSFVVNNDGSFVYTPEANFFGTDSFQYFFTNVTTGMVSNAATVTITVRPEADVPIANPDFYATNEDVALVVNAPGVLANDINVDGGLIQSVLISAPSFGIVSLQSDGSFVYTPDPNFNGIDTFTYVAVNAAGSSSPATVTINVRPVADTPVAHDDSYSTLRGTRLTVPTPGILGNDTDNDFGTILTAILVNPPQNGTLSLNPNGGFVYTPFANFAGTDTFTYRASDGTLASNLATVTIVVEQVAPPTIWLDQASDTGISQTDRITKDNTPTFLGTGRPGQTITILAQPSGSQPAVAVGSGVVDSAGRWQVTTQLLADDTYTITAVASNPDGLVTDNVNGGWIMIDTVAPVVTNAVLSPRSGQVYFTFQDNRSGMAQPTLGNAANYSFTKITTKTPRVYAVNGVQVLPAIDPASPQSVAVNVFGGKHVIHGRYVVAALSGGIADVAGNALDGEFNGSYPSGNGTAGGDFFGQFDNYGRDNSQAIATTAFVPIISTPQVRTPKVNVPVVKPTKAIPSGPRAMKPAQQAKINALKSSKAKPSGRPAQ